MKISKKIARKLIFPLAMKLGVDKILRKQSKNSILNVMYHGVVEEDSCYFSPRHITKTQFEKHLIYYKKHFTIISVDEAFKMISRNEKLKKKYITISFDDGFKNNLTTALPLLEKYTVPTTFFISSVCLDESENKYLWSEAISALIYFYKNKRIEIKNKTFINFKCTQTRVHITDYIKTLPYNERDEVLNILETKYDLKSKIESLPNEIWSLMNKEELIKFSKSKIVTIGSHAHRHFNLANISSTEATEELSVSKQKLSEVLEENISLIAYPDGSYNEEVKDISEKLKYTGQLAVSYKFPSDSSDKRIMNRHGVSSTTTFESNMLMLNRVFKTKGIN